ncbi:murein hydrolase domain-containing protein [[Clostridium] sordellii]|uniref:C39 family peptidase n=3 Tax=Paraclostridium sordellii TaxID=1505 RepID=UPI0005E38A16|nr:C39 family peptidase [Paeniclostridium sordellii]MCQ4696871.1 C39 family peptidase [Paeniclostridium sordellii]MDU2148028.1 C39 family peptidase [Paeniclostridium sordellii]MDU4413215.1 C39 family peptidase [Paeniclostridium sordellii]MDU6483147.1 C39 family peptidase [Paeniclostridium sordellii]CEN83518.1 murein hydrolase domain-containing protein [[Clostridium] sordellii] [Paeniclostridium sordellii]
MNHNIKVYKKKFSIGVVIILSTIVLFLIYITFSKISLNKSSNKDFLITRNEIINNLEKQAYSNSKINSILKNIDKYPSELLELLSNNIETLDFVYDYPDHLQKNKKSISIKDYYKSGEIPLFLQWDEKWGYDKYGDDYIAVAGCAPTSLSMVAVGLTGNTDINPLVVSNYAYDNGFYVEGVGSSWSLISTGARHFGLDSQELHLSKSSILSTLEAGNPIIVTVGPGTFTSTGHFLVLTGLTSDGKIKINDPNSKYNSSKSWDVDVFLKETRNLWKISKL